MSNPLSYQGLITAFTSRPNAELELFFESHGLGTAFRRPGPKVSKLTRINAALAEAEAVGYKGEVIRSITALVELPTSDSDNLPGIWDNRLMPSRDLPSANDKPSPAAKDPRSVFLVHGRNSAAKAAVVRILESLDLVPIEWEDAVAELDTGSPTTLQVVEAGIRMASAVVVLMTPDDVVYLNPSLLSEEDDEDERGPVGQARPNVILEAGMAIAMLPKRYLFVHIGKVRRISDTAGLNYIQLNDDYDSRERLSSRLETMGLAIKRRKGWHEAGDLASVLATLPAPSSSNSHLVRLQAGQFQQGSWRLSKAGAAKYSLVFVGTGQVFDVKVSGHETLVGPRDVELTPNITYGPEVTFTAYVSPQTQSDLITVTWSDEAGQRQAWSHALPPS